MREIRFRDDILPLKDKLFRLALRVTLDREEAEDIVQDTMLKLWERRDEWQKIESLEAFSMTLCRNLALDHCKSARMNNMRLDDTVEQSGSSITPLDELDSKMRLEALKRLIEQLPEVQRSILMLRDNEGKRYDEIASILGISESQVKVYLHRARIRLKEQLSQFERHGL